MLSAIHPILRPCLRKYHVVVPKKVTPIKEFPLHILKPPYITNSFISPIEMNSKIEIKTETQIKKMKASGKLARKILDKAGRLVKPGVTTDFLDKFVHDLCISNCVYPSPLFYKGFPKSICTSINNVICHGIPDNRILENGDIINIDVTIFHEGYHGDVSHTYFAGDVDSKGKNLVKIAKLCRDNAIAICKPKQKFSKIGEVISETAKKANLFVIPDICGHGIGSYFHGPPEVLHCEHGSNLEMEEGMTFTIEPVICESDATIVVLEDGWTIVTEDNSRSAQFEHTILITKDGFKILTK